MSVNFGSGITIIQSFWTAFKASVASKGMLMQYVDDGTIITIFSFDGPSLVYMTVIYDGTVPDGLTATYSQAQNDSDKTDFNTNFKPTANKPSGTNPSVTTTGSTTASASAIGGLDTTGKLQAPQVGHRRLFIAGEPAGVMNEYLPGRAAGIAFEPSNWFSFLNAGGTISTSNWTVFATANSLSSQARLVSMASYAPSGSYGGQPVILEMDIDIGSVATGATATWGFADASPGASRNAVGGTETIYFGFVGGAANLTIGVGGTTTTVTLPSAGKHRYYIYWYTDKTIFYIDSPTTSVYEFDFQTSNGHTIPTSAWIVCDITSTFGVVASFVCSQVSVSAAYPDRTGASIIQPVSYASALYQSTAAHADRPSGAVSTTATTWTYIRASTFAAAAAATTFILVSSSASDTAAGVGARKIQVIYVVSNGQRRHIVVIMNGTTNVTTTLPFTESAVTIEQMHVVSTGSTPNAVGNITATISGTTVAVINAGDNRTLYAHRYIPDGSSLLITGMTIASTVGAGQFRIVAVANGGLTTGTVFPIQLTEPIRVGSSGPSVRIQFDPPLMIGPDLLNANPYTYSNGDWAKMMAAIQWQADTVTANKALAGFDCMEINP